MNQNEELSQQEMNEFIKDEFPDDVYEYEKLIKLSEDNNYDMYPHSIRNFVLLFFIPIIVV